MKKQSQKQRRVLLKENNLLTYQKNFMKNFKNLSALILISVFIPTFLFAQTMLETNTQTRTSSDSDKKVEIETNTQLKLENNIVNTIERVIDPVIEPVKEVMELNEDEADNEEKEGSNENKILIRKATAVESVRTVSESLNEIEEESKIVESEVRAEIKNSIDKSILDIRSQTDIEAYELQRVVDDKRNEIYKDINTTIKTKSLTDSNSVRELETRVQSAVSDIEKSLEDRSGIDIDVSENTRRITTTLVRYEEKIEEKKTLINEREGELLERDTDEDGISDYDEKFIYNTNPESAYTIEGGLTDAEKIRAGINPTSENNEPINYQDPREDRETFISKIHKLERVELVKDETTQENRLNLSGQALPNSFVTVYIFSTPTIVTVKTDARGEWSYTLDKELENGEHEVYVATVDNSGRLIARSESIAITQTAEAAALGTFGIGETSPAQNDFVQDNFILIILAILLAAIILTLILSGAKKGGVKDFMDENKV